MTPSLWKQIVDVTGIVAILIGLFFVYQEIRQNSTIARAELSTNSVERRNQLENMMLDPEFAALYLKGLRTPADLEEVERRQLNEYFRALYTIALYERRNFRLGIFSEFTIMTRALARRHFVAGYGRVWWDVSRDNANPEVARIIDAELARVGGRSPFLDFDNEMVRQLEAL